MGQNEYQTKDKYKKIIRQEFPNAKIEFINISGSTHQPVGLPDWLILIREEQYFPLRLWLEVKRNWKDEPSEKQKWWISNLRSWGFITGFITDDGFKSDWSNKESIPFRSWLRNLK